MRNTILISTFFFVLFSFSCTQFGSRKDKLETKVVEYTQDNISKAKVSNSESINNLIKTSVLFELNPELQNEFPTLYSHTDYSLKSSNVTRDYLNRASNLIGSSELSPIEIRNEVLGLITNNQEYISFARKQSQIESKLIGDKRENDRNLIDYGREYEKERNESIVARVKFWGTISLLMIGGILAFIYGWPLISSLGIIPTALSFIPKKTLVKKVRAANNFLGSLDFMKKQEMDKGDTNRVKMLDNIVQMFKDINRKEEDERDHKMVKEIRMREL